MARSLAKGLVFWLVNLFPLAVFGGQSLVLNSAAPYLNVTDGAYPDTQSWRVEFQLYGWTVPAANVSFPQVFSLYGLGAAAYLSSDGFIALQGRDPVVEQQPCNVSLAGRTNVLVRLQKNVAALTLTCEIWNSDGTSYATQTDHIQSFAPPTLTGGVIGYNVTADLAFLRVFTTIVPPGSRPPTTADGGNYMELKFDGNLLDSSGNGNAASGPATFVSTPRQAPVALLKIVGTPSWSTWISLRAGFPAQLDGSQSYSMADGSSSVSYYWGEISGPSGVIWTSRTTSMPTVTGLVFGTYNLALAVTDSAGNTNWTAQQVPAVASDNNGVVVNANPAADAIFGPMIAFGRNPWSWADARNVAMENFQQNTYATTPSWSNPAEANTVSYTFFDPYSTQGLTTLTGGITAGALTIPVVNAGKLDLSSLPTEILVGNQASWEIMRICSATGNTLTVCYDGRGFHYGRDTSYIQPATAWKTGTAIWQAKVKGSGTHFLSTMCAYGAGWTAGNNYPTTSNGTLAITAGSASATGIGTSWNGSQNSLAIAVYARHQGTPFTFLAYVVSAGWTSLTLSRPFPADADSGSYTYKIFSDQRNVVLHYTRTDSTSGYIYFPTAGCESDTALYLYMGWDNAYANQTVAASQYSYMDGSGYVSDFSPNYYDLGLAHYSFYLRSGYTPSLTAARNIEDYWIRYPENAQGDAGGNPRDKSLLGVFAAAVLDGDRAGNWPGLRTYAQNGITTAQANNCNADPRETAYQMAWLSLAAEFDPNPAQRVNWQNGVTAAYARDNGCKGSDNSFASGFYWNPAAYPQVLVTQNSAAVTPASGAFPASMCSGTAWGTALATNGLATLTGLTGAFVAPAGNYQIVVGGTLGGARYDLSAQFDFNSAGSITLSALWPGDTGTVYWVISNNNPVFPNVATIATGPSDPNFGQIFGCTLTDSTHMTLHRPWTGAGGTYGFTSYNLVGSGSQPFMIGIKALQMRYGGQVYAPYQSLDAAAANWVGTTGFDTATKGLYYGRGFPVCEPALVESGITDAPYRIPNCIENSYNQYATTQARARNSEAQNAMSVMYLANPTGSARATGDLFYGAIFGASGFTAPGYWGDGVTASNLDNGSLSSYKWPGFFFGVGMAHQWPAVRLGGVAPPQYRNVGIAFSLGAAASARILITAPSGAVTTFPCGSVSPCSVLVDDRQGTHWSQIQYLSPGGAVLTTGSPVLLAGPA